MDMKRMLEAFCISAVYIAIYYFLKISNTVILDSLTTIPVILSLLLLKKPGYLDGFILGFIGAGVAAGIDLNLLSFSAIFRSSLMGLSTAMLALKKPYALFLSPLPWAIFQLVSGKGIWQFVVNYLSTAAIILIFKKEGIENE